MTQILHPIHSRISSMRPSSILFGKKGSAIEGRAQPIKSSVPLFIIFAITSGLVKRPTPTIGRSVSSCIPLTKSCCAASSLKRDGPEQSSQVPCAKSHRSGKFRFISTNSRTSALENPKSPMVSSRETLRVIPMVSPMASRMSDTTSFTKRARFSRLPPYSSVR